MNEAGWREAWAAWSYRTALGAGVLLALTLAACLPFFFALLQQRPGSMPFDPVLARFAAVDVTVPVFVVLYAGVAAGIALLARKPLRLLHMVWAYALLLVLRMCTMYLFTFEPPAGIIPLQDPVTALFYPGGVPFLKDLFFSGHTATLVLFGLAVGPGRARLALWVLAAAVGALVMAQHVHWTVDVVAAPFFAALAWWMACRLMQRLGLSFSVSAGA
ncbi:MAG: hypothetical protein JNL05_02350 [Flavobacteriales bacterium]|nr:hypothetical protein [Flavobacteriales bacterium]